MEQVVKEDIIAVLGQAAGLLEAKESAGLAKEVNFFALGELSNHTIHNASIFQDEDSISVAIAVYAMSKIFQKCSEKNILCPNLAPLIESAKNALEQDNIDGYRAAMKSIFATIEGTDKRITNYIQEVLEKAKLKKGSKLAEHGISVAKTAEIMGISQWELMSYIGNTTTESPTGIGARQRYAIAMNLFG